MKTRFPLKRVWSRSPTDPLNRQTANAHLRFPRRDDPTYQASVAMVEKRCRHLRRLNVDGIPEVLPRGLWFCHSHSFLADGLRDTS